MEKRIIEVRCYTEFDRVQFTQESVAVFIHPATRYLHSMNHAYDV